MTARLSKRFYEVLGEDMEQRLAELWADLVRWMFGFWVTTMMALAGVLLALHGGCSQVQPTRALGQTRRLPLLTHLKPPHPSFSATPCCDAADSG